MPRSRLLPLCEAASDTGRRERPCPSGDLVPAGARPRAARRRPATRRAAAPLAAAATLLALALLFTPAGARAAPPDFFARFPADGKSGEAAGRLGIPRGIVAEAALPGNLYVADSSNDRIDVFGPWGQFVRAFGWDVIPAGAAEDTGTGLEVCTAQSGCQGGLRGSGAGQFDAPASVALDSAGNLYVTDENPRVQKFDREGNFLLAFGWGVRDGSEEAQTCGPEASPPTETCQAGKPGSGESLGKGQITGSDSSGRLAVGFGDEVFLANGERIEVFGSDGSYVEGIAMPIASPGRVESVAVDAASKLYASFRSGLEKFVARKLEPHGPEHEFIDPEIFDTEEMSPVNLALDATGRLYVTVEGPYRILEIDPAGNCLNCGAEGEGGEPGFDRSEGSQLGGIATGGACQSDDDVTNVYVSHFMDNSYVKIFGPHPDTDICPPPRVPPTIEASWAAAVDTSEAELAAQINPHFWADTTYYLEYGTAPCTEGGCEALPAAPGRLLSEEVTGEAVTVRTRLSGLAPHTTYHYRFVAAGSGSEGEEVRGTGGEPGAEGAEGTFTTFAAPEPPGGCPNERFRTGAGAYLPDCRAYELVSPLDKNNGDVVPGEAFVGSSTYVAAGLEQSSVSGDRLAYSSTTAFADAVSAPYVSQYIAAREAGSGWHTHAISPPRGRVLGRDEAVAAFGHDTEFKIFSPDLCDSWLRSMTDAPLAAGEAPASFNVYRRTDRLCAPGGEDRYEALTTIAPTDGGLGIRLAVQGASADRGSAIYAARNRLTPEARAVGVELPCEPGPEVGASEADYRWLRNAEPIAGAKSSTYTTTAADAGAAIQCRVTMVREAEGRTAGATSVSGPLIVSPDPPLSPPRAPGQIPAPAASAPLAVGGAGGQELDCGSAEAGWEGSPSFEYAWYRNGEPIEGATGATYELTEADLASAAAFQCELVATNAGGGVVATSAALLTDPAPSDPATPSLDPRLAFDRQLYVHGAGGRTRLVCILPSEARVSCLAGTTFQANIENYWASLDGAISADGSRVFWSTPAFDGGAIYVRENPLEAQSTLEFGSATGTGRLKEGQTAVSNVKVTEGEFAAGQTIAGPGIPRGTTIVAAEGSGLTLSEPATEDNFSSTLTAHSDCDQPEKACTLPVSEGGEALSGASSSRFLAATPDGSKVLFIAKGAGVSDLYEYDLEAEETTKIAGGVAGIMGASEDLGTVYLLSTEAIAESGKGVGGAEAQPGEPNLYRYAGGEHRFIAALVPADANTGEGKDARPSPVAIKPFMHLARVSADGHHLAFTSLGRPTGYDNTDRAGGEPATEVYVYDAGANGGAGELVCASCNPSGARPVARTEGDGRAVAASLPGWANSFYAPRALAEDGDRVFFTSHDALAPRDANGRADVYQWEAPGKGGCSAAAPRYAPANGGCVSLISAGTSPRDSEFRDADPGGENVFFATLSSLVPHDYGLVDVYDARAGGGLPGPASAPPSCEGEACQSPPGPPAGPTPASEAFRGAGNLRAGADCARPARRARGLSRRAKALRRRAARMARRSGRAPARRMSRKAGRLARRAGAMSKRARRCRRAQRRGASKQSKSDSSSAPRAKRSQLLGGRRAR